MPGVTPVEREALLARTAAAASVGCNNAKLQHYTKAMVR
jgi:hypothetical protein